MKHEAAESKARDEFFSSMERALIDTLAAAGYTVIPHDSQNWAACHSLSKENTEGAVMLFLGPLREHDACWMLPYEIVREADASTCETPISRDTTPESAATLFLHHISGALTNRLPQATSGNVGVGLLSVQEASSLAEMAD
jgi:hypothetical protein